jgi:hypothetical protein
MPDEKFWIRYSPHHEAPLSSVSSLGIHVLIVALLLIGGYYISKSANAKDMPPRVDVVDVDRLPSISDDGVTVPNRGGGGGGVTGQGNNPASDTREDVGPAEKRSDSERPPETSRPDLAKTDTTTASSNIQVPSFDKDPAIRNLLDQANETAAKVTRLNENLQDQLRRGVRSGKGEGGTGSGGGKGSGQGEGVGGGHGPGQGLTAREKRVLRWAMVFSTYNGQDYAKQLKSLGAYLAIPDHQDPSRFLVIRDLSTRPAHMQHEDVSQIKRIFWIDDKPQSVHSLATALGLRPIPPRIVAFFPEELEKKLLRLELSFGGRREEDIRETRFEIVLVRPGHYEPRVTSQTPY